MPAINTVFTILIALVVFGAMIFIHELGHFLCARAFGVTVNEFSLGMGPKILGRKSKKSGTLYSLRLLPIGGYVRMLGEDETAEGEGALCLKPVWQRIIITAAGGIMNLILGVILTLALVLASPRLGSTTVGSFNEGGSCLESAGVRLGDRITAVGHVSVHTSTELIYEVIRRGIAPVDITVERNGEKLVFEDVQFPTTTSSGIVIGTFDFKVDPEEKSFGNIVRQTFYQSVASVKLIWTSLFDLLTGRYGIEAVSGPVGITQTIGSAARQGSTSLLYTCALIAVNLGVFNLMPLPALDGGRLVFLLVELIRRKPVKPEIEGYIHFAGLAALLALMLLITFKDVIGLF